MTITEKVRANQDIKEMTRRAIKILKISGENVDNLEKDFYLEYGETV